MVGTDGGRSTRFDSGGVSERAFSISTERRVGRGIVVLRGFDVAGAGVVIPIVVVNMFRIVRLQQRMSVRCCVALRRSETDGVIPTIVVATIAAHRIPRRVMSRISEMLIVLSAAPTPTLVARLVRLLHSRGGGLGDVAGAHSLVALDARSGKSLILAHGEIRVEVGLTARFGTGVCVVVGVLRAEGVGGRGGIGGARVDSGGILGVVRAGVVGGTAASVAVPGGESSLRAAHRNGRKLERSESEKS